MKLLIVDDQVSVVRGLMHGVDWKRIGFDTVDTANSAGEAMESLIHQRADVMLCDIEMPGGSGLELVKWLRSRDMDTRCIFLTAHAKFDYARDAIHLGGFDYIVQPAPYDKIAESVCKALADVKAETTARVLQQQGKLFGKNRQAFAAEAIRNVLLGLENTGIYSSLEQTQMLPDLQKMGWLVLVQILEYENGDSPWQKSLLAYALQNMSEEIFAPLQIAAVVCSMPEEQVFALVLQHEADGLNWDEIHRQLIYLQNACRQYLGFTSAIYPGGPIPVSQMHQLWLRLLRRNDNNVTKAPGVFDTDSPAIRTEAPLRNPRMGAWKRLLRDGYCAAVEQEAAAILDEEVRKHRLDARNLRIFYQDFMQMVFSALDHSSERIHDLFSDPESMELYRNGMKSPENMKALIHHVTVQFEDVDDSMDEDVVARVCEYISAHLESELRREELAEVVHLNPDYLTRRFKKETGSTLREYVISQKMQEARTLLRTTSLPISFVAAKVGYSNFSHFSNSYKKQFGITPQEDRQK